MAFPNTPVLDTLAGASLSSSFTTPSLGEPHTVLQDASGAYASGSDATTGSAYYNPKMVGADCEVYATVTAQVSGNLILLWARVTNPGGASAPSLNCYLLDVFNGTSWTLYKAVAGTFTALNTFTNQVISNGDSFGLSVVGSTITAYYKAAAGSWVTNGNPFTDTAIAGPGYIGFGGVARSDHFPRLKNFGGGTLVPKVVGGKTGE